MNYNIKIAKEEDITKVYELCKEVKANYPYWDEYYPLYDDFLESYEDGYVVVCEQNSEIIGCLCVEIGFYDVDGYADAIALSRFMVKETCRRQGIGKEIFEYTEMYVKKLGYNKIVFLVHNGNSHAMNLYLKWGYTDKGQVKLFWDNEIVEDYHLVEKTI